MFIEEQKRVVKKFPEENRRSLAEDQAASLYNQWDKLTKEKLTKQNIRVISVKLERIEKALTILFSLTSAFRDLGMAKRLEEIDYKLREIDKLMKKNHAEMKAHVTAENNRLKKHFNKKFSPIFNTLQRIELTVKDNNERIKQIEVQIDRFYKEIKKQN